MNPRKLSKLYKEQLDDLLQTCNRRRKVSLNLQNIFNVNINISKKKEGDNEERKKDWDRSDFAFWNLLKLLLWNSTNLHSGFEKAFVYQKPLKMDWLSYLLSSSGEEVTVDQLTQ